MDIVRHFAIGALVLLLVVVPLLLWLDSLGTSAGLLIAAGIAVQSAAVAVLLVIGARKGRHGPHRHSHSD
jgi:hypothetical protein